MTTDLYKINSTSDVVVDENGFVTFRIYGQRDFRVSEHDFAHIAERFMDRHAITEIQRDVNRITFEIQQLVDKCDKQEIEYDTQLTEIYYKLKLHLDSLFEIYDTED